jgi:hypothetical protein
MADGRRVTLGLRVSEDLAAALDEARGDVTRSAWLEAALREALAQSGAAPVTGTRAGPAVPASRTRRIAPVAADFERERAQDARRDACDHPKGARDPKTGTRCRCGALGLPPFR